MNTPNNLQTVTIDHKNGHSTESKLMENGTAYHISTPQEVVNILERCLYNGNRIKMYYGDPETGKDWNEEHGMTGTIGRSIGGKVKIPLLVANKRSHGGGAILDHCIVKIKDHNGVILYKHPLYHSAHIEIKESDLPEFKKAIYIGGTVYSRHKTERSAKILFSKLS